MKMSVDRKPGNSGPFTPECEKQVKTDPMLKKREHKTVIPGSSNNGQTQKYQSGRGTTRQMDTVHFFAFRCPLKPEQIRFRIGKINAD